MRRIATVLSALAMTGAAGLALPSPAFAAHGTLTFAGGPRIENPSGCYRPNIWPLTVHNDTDGYARVYVNGNCSGKPIKVVSPHGSATEEFGDSVYIR
ncbi:hypothetical protein AB0L06_11240 [Spirillospora sp. NPDC052269]